MKRKLITAVLIFSLVFILSFPAYAAEENQNLELSLDQAISRALKYSKALKDSKLDVELADETQDAAAAGWLPSYNVTYPGPEKEGDYASLLIADYSYDASQKGQELQEDVVTAEARKLYYDVLQAVNNVSVKESAFASAEKDFAISQAYSEVGMLSKIAFDQASMQLVQKRAELTAAENELENAYIAFNRLVGLDPEARPVLTGIPDFQALEVDKLSLKVSSIVAKNPLQWNADTYADLKERLIGFAGYLTPPKSVDQAQLEAEQAELEADKLREDMTEAVYSLYYSIKSMEGTYQTAQEAVALAEESLRLAELKHEVGMGTAADVAEAEAALAEAEHSLLALTCQHELLKIVFEKPWTYSALLGSSSSGSSSSHS